MEWVETTAKSIDEAKDRALDQLGVGGDEAEFEVLEEPKTGLFGRVRGEARVRARVKPAAVRPKQERRQRGRNQKRDNNKKRESKSGSNASNGSNGSNGGGKGGSSTGDQPSDQQSGDQPKQTKQPQKSKPKKENKRMEERPESNVTPQEVGDAAVAFMSDLASAFGVADADTQLTVDGTDLDVRVTGTDVGLMVGPGGRTLTAVQDLARVASQRRLGDHDTRLRIDVGGYREKRRAALEKFAATVAAQVLETGTAKALEPMASADRKAVHDAVIEIDGVTSHSQGDDPARRVVITPE